MLKSSPVTSRPARSSGTPLVGGVRRIAGSTRARCNASSQQQQQQQKLVQQDTHKQQHHKQQQSSQRHAAATTAGAVLALTALQVTLPEAATALAIRMEPANALSLPTWAIHVSSVTEWVAAMALMWKYAEVSGNPRWKGMTWGMMPSLGSAMAACTWHFFYNSPE
jgi:hypothetical protein